MALCKRGHDQDAVGRYPNNGGESGRCRACCLERVKKYRENNRQKTRANHRRRQGMTGLPETEAQIGDPCDCCTQPMKSTPHADHDHATGAWRGWVCRRCNIRLAAVDDANWMQRATEYKRRHEKR